MPTKRRSGAHAIMTEACRDTEHSLLALLEERAPSVRLRFRQKADRESTLLRDGSVDFETGVVGLGGPGHWTLVVESQAELAAVRGRLEAAGAPVEQRADGILTHDPAGIPLLIRA
mgnify:CR=1 FL=1